MLGNRARRILIPVILGVLSVLWWDFGRLSAAQKSRYEDAVRTSPAPAGEEVSVAFARVVELRDDGFVV